LNVDVARRGVGVGDHIRIPAPLPSSAMRDIVRLMLPDAVPAAAMTRPSKLDAAQAARIADCLACALKMGTIENMNAPTSGAFVATSKHRLEASPRAAYLFFGIYRSVMVPS
jgi:hypothetical protein